MYFLFPETSGRTLEELTFCTFSFVIQNLDRRFLTLAIVYEGDQLRKEQEKRVQEEIQHEENEKHKFSGEGSSTDERKEKTV